MTSPRPVATPPSTDPRPSARPATVAGGKAHWDALTTEAIATGGLTAQQVANGYDPSKDPVVSTMEQLPYSGSVPANLRTTARTTTSIALAWGTVPNATTYRLRDNGVDVSGATALASPSFSHTGLTAGSTHTYTVSALVGGVRQSESPVLTATTPAS